MSDTTRIDGRRPEEPLKGGQLRPGQLLPSTGMSPGHHSHLLVTHKFDVTRYTFQCRQSRAQCKVGNSLVKQVTELFRRMNSYLHAQILGPCREQLDQAGGAVLSKQ